MVISEVPASPGDITRCLFPAKKNKKRKKAKGTKRPPVQLRFVLSPLPKPSSARNEGTSSEGHRGETSLTTAPEETVIESEEEETAEPDLQTYPVPSKLYDISGAHNPYWYTFIKLVPRPEFEHLQKPVPHDDVAKSADNEAEPWNKSDPFESLLTFYVSGT
ncbi:hypothetical protein PR002_g17048 [Phytophthora rubi]|uniref:Uncharacterized protein n=1 Tax=Phytophthora rubi TaxID=129364 RepID=A0A6A3KBA4_9STRA|nr:hypothetical protein PR002_g17048 [Phytophthora rubi]